MSLSSQTNKHNKLFWTRYKGVCVCWGNLSYLLHTRAHNHSTTVLCVPLPSLSDYITSNTLAHAPLQRGFSRLLIRFDLTQACPPCSQLANHRQQQRCLLSNTVVERKKRGGGEETERNLTLMECFPTSDNPFLTQTQMFTRTL